VLDELLAILQASAERVLRGGEPIAAFVAVLDAEARTIAWASAGHPGAVVVDRAADPIDRAAAGAAAPGARLVALGGGGARLGAAGAILRGEVGLGAQSVVVIASSGVRRGDAAQWHRRVQDRVVAPAWLPALVGDAIAAGAPPSDDLLAVVVRQRRD
jgi:hypothetical protein